MTLIFLHFFQIPVYNQNGMFTVSSMYIYSTIINAPKIKICWGDRNGCWAEFLCRMWSMPVLVLVDAGSGRKETKKQEDKMRGTRRS
jgi:hypothetical protein